MNELIEKVRELLIEYRYFRDAQGFAIIETTAIKDVERELDGVVAAKQVKDLAEEFATYVEPPEDLVRQLDETLMEVFDPDRDAPEVFNKMDFPEGYHKKGVIIDPDMTPLEFCKMMGFKLQPYQERFIARLVKEKKEKTDGTT